MITSNYKNKILNSIVISGWPAVGKTTLATELASSLDTNNSMVVMY